MGGVGLLVKYEGSLIALLKAVYAEHNWLPWKFKKNSNHFWSDMKNRRNFMDAVGKELGIKEMSDWYKITTKVCFLYFQWVKISGILGNCEKLYSLAYNV